MPLGSTRYPLALTLAFAAAGMGAGPSDADGLARDLAPGADALAPWRWQKRPVVIFAEHPDDPQLDQALAALASVRAALADRDIVVLTDTDPRAATALRQRFAPEGFAMLLFGKDGGLKLRSGQAIAPETLFATIDAMPMRRQEMRRD
ncbi:DUF4174 domain-containing protein [Vannielia litorea]|uniref:DUF4174 domain-containing protein n=1 Tax=Vannielia litorea TaxID=1217970 RepID=A0A1N6F230_9RHOB|nr:DUF4174 domain-containing protein [Vannielia litorea]SIN89340.1 protein of unknown function [Vannielia litorea]